MQADGRWTLFLWCFLTVLNSKVLTQDCGDPGEIEYGEFAGSTVFGGDAQVVCWNGFIGDGLATCAADSSWDTLSPCSPIDCTSQTITNGILGGDTVFNGTTAITCNTGYTAGGTAFCLTSGDWHPLPTCTAIDCLEPDIYKGKLSVTSVTVYDGIATVECDVGYEVVGSATATCLQDGTWDTMPVCEPKDCGTLPVAHALLTTGSSTRYGGRAEVECETGYIGYGFATCLDTGNWETATLPTCTPIDCGEPFVLYGFLAAGTNTVYDGNTAVDCSPGYEGGGAATCLDTGEYDTTTMPVCNPVDCGPPGDPNGGLSGESFYAGKGSITCNLGYTGGGPITCLDTGVWDLSTATTCVLVDCGPPDEPNGDLIGDQLYSKTASIFCDTGYVGGGPLTCLATGAWDTSLAPTCVLADCGTLPVPINGDITVTTTTYGSTAEFSCDPLYQMSGTPVLACLANGAWSSPSPTCEDIDCHSLTPPNDGSLSTNAKTVGTLTYVLCDSGFSLFGLSPLTCETGGTWDDVVGVCKKDCAALVKPTYGLLSTSEFKEGTTVKVKCYKGYTMFGDSILHCLPGGTWNTTVPNCVRECGSLVNPSDGLVSHPDGTTLDDVTTYTCDTGYYLSHINSRTCQADGIWSNKSPVCVIYDCEPVMSLENGGVTYPGGTTYNQTLVYSCNIGYDLIGNVNRKCQADGSWDGTDPFCQIRDCGPLPSPTDGSVDTSGGTTYLSVAEFSCSIGYTMDGDATSTCQSFGNWSTVPPVCDINDCGPLSDPLHGNVTHPATTYAQQATYFCQAGYYVNGVTTRMCQANSSWSETEPACSIKDCGALAAPDNGDVTYSNSATTYQEEATFSCHTGYDLTGDISRTCQEDGLWGGSSPVCQIKDCGSLANPVNGGLIFSNGTTYNEVVDYFCDAGYNTVGDTRRLCQSDGQWDGNSTTCQIKDCGNLVDPTEGVVNVSLTTYGETAIYYCNAGYYLIGAKIRNCQSDGNWSDTAPGCARKDCGDPLEIENGNFTIPVGTRFEDSAIYACAINYGLVGSATVECLDSGEWSTEPFCSKDCGTPVDIDNGAFPPPNDTLMGAMVTYTCNDGYEMVRIDTVTCEKGGVWSQAPGCRLVPKAYNEECLVTTQCETKNATCRAEAGETRCLCMPLSEVYDDSVDSCLAHCDPLSTPTDGSVALPPVTSEGQIAVYSCDLNFALTDRSLAIRTCLSTGDWSGAAPSCTSGCQPPVPPDNGYVNVTQGYVTGHRVYYSCAPGYILDGDEERTCLSESYPSGEEYTLWSGVDPVCRIECPVLSGISSGNVDLSKGRWEDSIATYVCENNYALIGDAIRRCLPTGQWKGVEPYCVIAIFPDLLMAIGGVMIFLVVIDLFVIMYVIYQKLIKKKKAQKYTDSSDDKRDLLKGDDADEQLHPGMFPVVASGPARSSFISGAKLKADTNKEQTPGTPRIEQARSTLPRPHKQEPEQDQKYEDANVPFEPLFTSEQEAAVNQQNEKQSQETEFEKFLQKEFETQSFENDLNRKELPDEDLLSIDLPTNPLPPGKLNQSVNNNNKVNKRQNRTLPDASTLFKGRMSLPKAPDGRRSNADGEPFYSEEARRYLKESMETYSPINPNLTASKP